MIAAAERAVDDAIFGSGGDGRLETAIENLLALDPGTELEVLLRPSSVDTQLVDREAGTLGSYLATRMVLRGYRPVLDRASLFALADAIRSVDPIGVLRWRWLIGRLATDEVRAMIDVILRQSHGFEEALVAVANPISIAHERSILT